MMFETIKKILMVGEDDPVWNCKLYKEIGCSHVDGMLCDFPECSMNKEYTESEVKQNVRANI